MYYTASVKVTGFGLCCWVNILFFEAFCLLPVPLLPSDCIIALRFSLCKWQDNLLSRWWRSDKGNESSAWQLNHLFTTQVISWPKSDSSLINNADYLCPCKLATSWAFAALHVLLTDEIYVKNRVILDW